METQQLIKELEKRWVSRGELIELTGLPDEQMRDVLRDIRKSYPLVNFQNAKGYHISYSPNEIREMARQERARANQIYQNVKVLEAWADKCEGKEEKESNNLVYDFLNEMMGV